MTAEIINLSKARKARARADKGAKAAQNRALFGRTKADKALVKAVEDKTVRLLDQSKREKPPEDSGK
jgi:hypothetical protein